MLFPFVLDMLILSSANEKKITNKCLCNNGIAKIAMKQVCACVAYLPKITCPSQCIVSQNDFMAAGC